MLETLQKPIQDMLFELILNKSLGFELSKSDPYMELPGEDQTYKYVIQSHHRGRSYHLDFRIESTDKKYLIGWTWMAAIKGAIKEPVHDMAAARKYFKDPDAWKIIWKEGKSDVRKRKTSTGELTNIQLLASTKAREPCISIGSLIVKNQELAQAGELKVGDKILTADGDFKEITKIQRVYKSPQYEIKPTHSLPVVVDSEHLFLVNDVNSRVQRDLSHRQRDFIKYHLNLRWKCAKDLRQNDIILFPKLKIKEERYLGDFDLGRLRGFFLGDGSRSFEGKPRQLVWRFHFNKKESELLNIYQELLRKKGIHSWVTRSKDSVLILKFRLNKKGLNHWFLELYGSSNRKKEYPIEYLYSNLDFLKGLIQGLLDSDGYVAKKRKYFTNTNSSIINGLVLSLGRLGIVPTIRYRVNFGLGKKKIYELSWSNPDELGHKDYFDYGEFFGKRIRKVEKLDFIQPLVNIVTGDHTFCSPYLAMHNTEWLIIEGVVPIGDPEKPNPGATKEHPGVFLIVDKGTCDYLSQKEYYHEYHLDGKMFKRRIALRALAGFKSIDDVLEDERDEWFFAKQEILRPPREAAEERVSPEELAWVVMFPYDQMPYVLSRRAVEECLPAGSLIWTEDGMTPIEQIRVGKKVLGRTGFTKVIAIKKMLCKSSMWSIRVSNSLEYEFTSGHPILIANILSGAIGKNQHSKTKPMVYGNSRERMENGLLELSWKLPSEIDPKIDYVVAPNIEPSNEIKFFCIRQARKKGVSIYDEMEVELTYDTGFFLGLLMGDGSLDRDGVCFSISSDRVDKVAQKLKPFVNRYLKNPMHVAKATNGDYFKIKINNRGLSKSLSEFLRKNQSLKRRSLSKFSKKNKSLSPGFLSKTNRDFLEGIVEGLMLSDGDLTFKKFYNTELNIVATFLFSQLLLGLPSKFKQYEKKPAGFWHGGIEYQVSAKQDHIFEKDGLKLLHVLGKRKLRGKPNVYAIQAEDSCISTVNYVTHNSWMPSDGFSAVPRYLRRQISPNFRYWNKKGAEARAMRDALVEAIKNEEVKLELVEVERTPGIVEKALEGKTLPFVLQVHWWKGQEVIRAGPTTIHWDLRIDPGKDVPGLVHFVLNENPLEADSMVAIQKLCKDKDAMKVGRDKVQYFPPSTPDWNPTKNTPAYVKMLTEGEVTVFLDAHDFKKFEFENKLKGLWVMEREDPKAAIWVFKRSELPEAEKRIKNRFNY